MSDQPLPKHPFFVVSGPSGVGKNTVVEGVMEEIPELRKVKTYSSREPRPDELETQKKLYVSREEFEQKIEAGDFFEHATYAGNYYGTPKKELLEHLNQGPAITDIEVQGVEQMLETFPRERFVTIFLRPSSVEALVERIKERAPIDDDELEGRIERIKKEMEKVDMYDHVIVNEEGKVEDTIRIVSEHIRKSLHSSA